MINYLTTIPISIVYIGIGNVHLMTVHTDDDSFMNFRPTIHRIPKEAIS